MNKLKKKIIIQGIIHAVTGLHIGGTNNSMSIGELDNAVIRNPLTKEPYIPGSSLKGKMRSLIELAQGTIGDTRMGRDINYTPTNNPKHLAARLFGYTGYKPEEDSNDLPQQQPSRIIVRDAALINRDQLESELYTEVKAETVIDRITSAAMPRQLERVPAGAEFKLDMVLNIFEEDKEEELVKGIFQGLQLIQDDYLGGAGSRGSGQVRFEITKIDEKAFDFYTEGKQIQPKLESYKKDYIPESIEVTQFPS